MPLILHNFISDEEHLKLKEWINQEFISHNIPLLPSANKCYHNCYCTMDVNGIKEFNNVRDRVIEHFKIQTCPVALPLGHFIMVMNDGASLGKHRDSGDKHFRCNLLIKKPESGNVFIEGKAYETNEKDLCCFFPSEELHWSDKIVGQRFTCSFGFFVNKDWQL